MTLPCPRCGTALVDPPAGAPSTTTCTGCGLEVASAYLHESIELRQWHTWAGDRLAWLNDRMLAGDTPDTAGTTPGRTAPSPGAGVWAPVPTTERRPASAGSLLLALGAFLLVVAGIAFLAFTWDLLGPFGQIAVLLLIGAACLAAAKGLAARLHGTATTIGVVGALLVTIAGIGTRTLGPDLIGEIPSLLLAGGIGGGLCVAGRWLRPHAAGVGELAGIAGSTTAVIFLLSAPTDTLGLGDTRTWWIALVSLGSGAALVAAADRVGLSAWPWVGAGFLVVGAVALGATVSEAAEGRTPSDVEAVIVAATLAAAAASLGATALRALPHRAAVTTAVLTVWCLALTIALSSAITSPEVRPWIALVLVLTGLLGLGPALFDLRVLWLTKAVAVVGAAAIGAGVGTMVAPWIDPWADYLRAPAWADAAWPPWRGLVAGLAFVVLLVGSVMVAPAVLRRLSSDTAAATAWREVVPLVPSAAGLLTWLAASWSDLEDVQGVSGYRTDRQPIPDAFQQQVAIALLIVAVALVVLSLLRRLPAWSVWFATPLSVVTVVLALPTYDLPETLRPEVYGVALAAPTLVVAISWWWLRRPTPTPTWQTHAPVLTLAVLPSTLALLDDAGSRWWWGEDPGTAYQVRMVSLLTIGAVAAVLGGWRRWSGLFFPGLVLTLLVVGVELVELGRFLPQWVSFAISGALLIAAGARWEWVRDRGYAGVAWVRKLR